MLTAKQRFGEEVVEINQFVTEMAYIPQRLAFVSELLRWKVSKWNDSKGQKSGICCIPWEQFVLSSESPLEPQYSFKEYDKDYC